jgi:hypothetical protein
MSKSLRETLIDRYGEDVLAHPVFGEQHELLHKVTREQMFGPESEQTFARQVAGSEKAGQLFIDGGGKQSPKIL